MNRRLTPRYHPTSTVLLTTWLLSCGLGAAAEPNQAPKPVLASENVSLRNEVVRAIDKGLNWVEKNQDAGGFWSTADHPAITALALVALQGRPGGASVKLDSETREKSGTKLSPSLLVHGLAGASEAAKKGYQYLLGCVQSDGGIYRKKELINYNTAVSMMALLAANRPEYKPILLKARQFVIGLQSDFDQVGTLDNVFDGGVGYGNRYPHSDMSNTLLALEALYHSRHLVQDQGLAGARDLNWAAALQFIQSCQNLPTHNKEKWASDDPQNKGGFVYFPGHSMAGETNLPSGRVALRSYGSISYAGLLSYIYADLKRDDPRILAVFEWLRAHFTLDENPGLGPQGLFYYYHTMAKALNAYSIDVLELKEGRKIDWRRELALRLINLQQADGSWANENGRWWEKDPALVTAYAAITLEILYRGL